MSISTKHSRLIALSILFVLSSDLCFCMPSESVTSSLAGDGFLPAVGTWYSDNGGSGSGGGCGFATDVIYAPYYGMISAGNNNIFRGGAGCGSCYLVKCTNNQYCSGSPITVTITDECPGACNNEAFHFDLSGKAFGSLAKSGQGEALRNVGRINIEYKRTTCHYNSNIALKIDPGSNQYYLAFAVEDVNGIGEISKIDILASGSNSWQPMQRNWGETWKFDIPSGARGPYSVKITNIDLQSVVADEVIPGNWAPGLTYYSKVNFS